MTNEMYGRGNHGKVCNGTGCGDNEQPVYPVQRDRRNLQHGAERIPPVFPESGLGGT